MICRELKGQENPEPGLHEYICINPRLGEFVVYSKTRPRVGMIRKIHGAVWIVWGSRTRNGVTTAKLELYC